MSRTVFFRLLRTPVEAKGDVLVTEISALNATGRAEETFILDPADFAAIPSSPFPYWTSGAVLRIFETLLPLDPRFDVASGIIGGFDSQTKLQDRTLQEGLTRLSMMLRQIWRVLRKPEKVELLVALAKLADAEVDSEELSRHLDWLGSQSDAELLGIEQGKWEELSSFEPLYTFLKETVLPLILRHQTAHARQGLVTADDFRFVRTWWEVSLERLGYNNEDTLITRGWIHFAKGGVYSPFHADVHLLVDWEDEGVRIRNFFKPDGRLASRPQNTEFFFRPGLTWPLRTTSRISVRAMPAGCIFSHKGPGIYVPKDDSDTLLSLLAVANSAPFEAFVKLQLGAATAAARSYEVGIIQRTPIPPLIQRESCITLAALAREAHDLQREHDRSDETTHTFCRPGLFLQRGGSMLQASLALEAESQAIQARLATIQTKIDDLVFDLYGLSEADRTLVRAEVGDTHRGTQTTEKSDEEIRDVGALVAQSNENEEEEPAAPEDLPARVQNLLMWCVGVAFARWDVRFALDPALLPPLQGPFDPLPRCAPGALVGPDGLPPANAAGIAPESWLRARKNVLDLPAFPVQRGKPEPKADYPLPVVWNGILVDDPTHPDDIVTRVGDVLRLLWGEQAGAIEREACEILGFKTLRDYFRDPCQGFFAFHIKRYSKSRRKAPIYWLLQSERRNYAIWLYCHRLDSTSLYTAGRDYADVKLALEQGRLDELRQRLESLAGSTRKQREREADRQAKLVAEVADFRRQLDTVALLNLPPDLNDGVVISVAPLWELMPWKEAQRTWEKLRAGEYVWSTMAGQMRERGLAGHKV